jgi:hypothetical protein
MRGSPTLRRSACRGSRFCRETSWNAYPRFVLAARYHRFFWNRWFDSQVLNPAPRGSVHRFGNCAEDKRRAAHALTQRAVPRGSFSEGAAHG